ncbi:hypothetical protein [Halosegnis sp.]|uniref:hypothetical protein n=1 Tax=Halosegnis sp. TaxID=2864959 RepID=UPI0035D42954
MTDDDDADLEAAVEEFLADAERAYDEYEQGYADADATLRLLRSHLDRLRSEVD